MSKATEAALAELHGLVARHLSKLIENDEASASDVSAAIKFLKDNSITADIANNDDTADLDRAIRERKERRARAQLTPADQIDAAFSAEAMSARLQ